MGDSLQQNVPVGVHVCLCVGVNTICPYSQAESSVIHTILYTI